MYSLLEIFDQAKDDDNSTFISAIGYESVMVGGIKIIKDSRTKDIQLLNTMVTGNYYTLVKKEEINLFLEKGWKCGLYNLSLSNYRSKLDSIEYKIKDEITGRNSEKQLISLKEKRELTLKKYTQIKNKLNSFYYADTKEIKSGE